MSDHAHSLFASRADTRPMSGAARHGFGVTCLFAIFCAALTFLMMRGPLIDTWTTGAFVDTDDAMRLVQVRALLNGQAWFDMTARALDPPLGTFMHWSRVVDVPLALLIRMFGLVADPIHAERLARITFPFLMLVALYIGMARLAAELLGPVARLPAIAATVLSGNGVIQFLPGRIDHHAPRIVFLVVLLGAALAALDPKRARQAALAGFLAAMSLAISLENLPFIAFTIAAIVGLWIWHGAPLERTLAWLGAGLAVGLCLFFVGTVAPARYFLPVCDALGAAHVGAGLIGAAGCGCIALAATHLRSVVERLAVALVVAVAAAGFVAFAYPACLHDPFAAVDPLVRSIWLDNVQESVPVTRLFRTDRSIALFSLLPVVLGLGGCLFGAWFATGVRRQRFLVVSSVVVIGLALAFWQVRAFTSITAIAMCGGLAVAIATHDWCLGRGRQTLATASIALVFPFTGVGAGVFLPVDASPAMAKGEASIESCLTPSAMAPMNALSAGLVLAPVDLGSFLLADTHFTVLAAAFHRDNDGNRFAFDTMLAPPAEAGRLAAGRDVKYVVICPGLGETKLIAKRAPEGLAAALLADRVPDWLTPVPLAGTPFRVFRVTPAP